MPRITTLDAEAALERKRRADRERVAAKRAAMSPEQRADARREHDQRYKARLRERQS